MKPFIPSKLAELVFALVIVMFGVNHFRKTDMMATMVPSSMPGDASIWVYVTGTALILAAIAIIINKYKTLACYLLAAMLIVFVLTLHLKPAMDGNMGNLLKDTGLAMAAILIGNRK